MLSTKKSNFILTFDIGIKNLAYCIVKYDNNTNLSLFDNITIINWDIIDVSYKALYCKQIKNKRAVCNCISKYYSLIDPNGSHTDTDNLIGYCKNHAKNINTLNKDKKNLNKIKLFKISSNPVYTNNFNYQMDRLLSSLINFYDNIILSPYHLNNNKLDYMQNLEIFIENQPVLKNPIMKSISIALYTFFCLKKIINPKLIKSINFINATVKTKDIFITKINDILNIKSKIIQIKNYENRKNFTVDITNKFIYKITTTNIPHINNAIYASNYILNKKKDDFADTLIYVIYIIFFVL